MNERKDYVKENGTLERIQNNSRWYWDMVSELRGNAGTRLERNMLSATTNQITGRGIKT